MLQNNELVELVDFSDIEDIRDNDGGGTGTCCMLFLGGCKNTEEVQPD